MPYILTDNIFASWYMILVYVIVGLLIIGLIIFLSIKFKKKSKEQIEQEESESYVQKTGRVAEIFGGRDNIVSLEIKGSRVIVNVKSTSGIEPSKLDSEGLNGSIIMGDKVIFPVGSKAEEFAENLRKKIDE